MDNYVSGKKASEILGVCQLTLRNWDEKKVIDTIRASGGKRLYNVKKYMENKNIHNQPLVVNNPIIQEKMLYKNKYLYARVSTLSQKGDLERQIKVLTDKYPKYKLITDIGSGMNLNRKGLRSIIDKAIKGDVEEVVIVYKDRLCRFGYELIEDIITKYSKGKITILSEDEKKEPKEELVEDVLQIMNIFVAKINGMRKYEKNKKIKKLKMNKLI
jgi:predicted site-specific integrase-resolvase